jgi:hypothetical protein
MTQIYCNDCGEAFLIEDDIAGMVGQCNNCIHESGDCPRSRLEHCDKCQKLHVKGHRGNPVSPYCLYCVPNRTPLHPMFGGQ